MNVSEFADITGAELGGIGLDKCRMKKLSVLVV